MIAREIEKQEREKEEERKKAKEWEDTLKAIKEQAKLESDRQLGILHFFL